jgi:hypothetical protein
LQIDASLAGYRRLLKWASGLDQRRWAVENAQGVGPAFAAMVGSRELRSSMTSPSRRAVCSRTTGRFHPLVSAMPLVSRALNPQTRPSPSSLTSAYVSLLASLQLHTRKVAGSIPAGITGVLAVETLYLGQLCNPRAIWRAIRYSGAARSPLIHHQLSWET